ncbi:hypothetical protein D3C72_2081720 [compost metagenome]
MLGRVHGPAGHRGHIGEQPHPHVRIVVEAFGHEAPHLDVAAELFFDLAPERLLGRLAGLDLAAGELPEPGHGHGWRSQRAQDLLGLVHEHGAHDIDLLHGEFLSGPMMPHPRPDRTRKVVRTGRACGK